MGVSTHMSKTRSNQGWDCSNVSKTIDKQGIEERSGYCDNGPMGVSSPIYKTRSNLGSEGKCQDCSNVSKTIEKQGIKGSLEYCAKGPIKVSSPMYNIRPKKEIEEKWGDRSNVFKNIEKQDTERTLVHGANGKMTIGKSSFKKGMTTYAQKCKRAEIYKCKSAGGLQAKKKNMIFSSHHPKANIGVV